MQNARRAGNFLARAIPTVTVVGLFIFSFLQLHRTDEAANALRNLAPAQRAALVAGCERGNDLRAQLSKNVEVLDKLLATATIARRQSGDYVIARAYEQLRTLLEPIGAVDCERAFPRVP